MSGRRGDSEARGTEPAPEAAPAPFIETFTASMPGSYRLRYGEPTIREHAAIAWRRGGKPVHLEVFCDDATRGACLCVVTDDRPGLLALLTAAIASHAFDILRAEVFGRSRRWQEDEAVDFFWVRAHDGGKLATIDARHLEAISDTIASLLSGELHPSSLATPVTPRAEGGAPRGPEVRFEDDPTERLIVEADDRPGLLSAITQAVTSQSVLIVWSSVTTQDGRAHDEFRVRRHDGQRVTVDEKNAIVREVTASITSMTLKTETRGSG